MASIHWAKDANGTFENPAGWAQDAVPGSGDDAILDASGATPYTVTALANDTVGSIQTASDATLAVSGDTFTVLNGTGSGVNAGMLEAINGGTLALDRGVVNGLSGGVILARAGSQVDLGGGTLAGGTLETSGTGVFVVTNYGSVLDGATSTVSNDGLIETNDLYLTLEGTIDNVGVILINSGIDSQGGQLTIATGTTTLSGGGAITLTFNTPDYEFGINSPNAITGSTGSILVNSNNLISGAGTIGLGDNNLTLNNESGGVIDADNPSGGLTINTGSNVVVNAGLLEASAGGTLDLPDGMIDGSSGGVILAGAGSQVDLGGGTLAGGTLETSGTGVFVVTNYGSVLDGATSTVSNDGLIETNDLYLTLEGTIDNVGVILINSGIDSQGGQLTIATGTTTLSGGGAITLTFNTPDYEFGINSPNAITGSTGSILVNFNNLISGAGTIGLGDNNLTLNNESGGVIDADNPSGGLTINTGSNVVTNEGVLEASGNAILTINSTINNTGTLVANGGTLTVNAAITNNSGMIEAAGDGSLTINSPVNNNGSLYANGGTLFVNAAVTGSGFAAITAGTLDFTQANVAEPVDFLDASGTLELDQSQSYSGLIVGFSATGGNALDLRDISFVSGQTTASYSGNAIGGILTVTNGSAVARIHMAGQYASGDFTVASDGAGGTLINSSGPVATYAITPDPASVNEDGGQITFTITRSNTSQAATVYASTVQDQGYDNPDNEFYQGIIDQAVGFAIGQATATVRVTINDAGIPTGSETFGLIIQQLSGDNAVSDAVASDDFTIDNTDASGVILTPSAETVNGGTAVTYTVTLAHPSSQPVDLTWSTVAGTASAAGGDYTGVTDAPLHFNAGQTTNTFTVQTLAPPSAQGAESFQVVVQPKAAPGYDLAASTVTIAPSGPVVPAVTITQLSSYNLLDVGALVDQPFSGDLTLSDPTASYDFSVGADETVTYQYGSGGDEQTASQTLPAGDYAFNVALPSGSTNLNYSFSVENATLPSVAVGESDLLGIIGGFLDISGSTIDLDKVLTLAKDLDLGAETGSDVTTLVQADTTFFEQLSDENFILSQIVDLQARIERISQSDDPVREFCAEVVDIVVGIGVGEGSTALIVATAPTGLAWISHTALYPGDFGVDFLVKVVYRSRPEGGLRRFRAALRWRRLPEVSRRRFQVKDAFLRRVEARQVYSVAGILF